MHDRASPMPGDRRALPSCSLHEGSLVRPYRSHGPNGPSVYPQCVPGHGHDSHLLAWVETAARERGAFDDSFALTKSELEVLIDAAEGLSTLESATRRHKGRETIKTQRSRVLSKFQARNMTHAVALATANGLIQTRKAT